MPLVDLVQVVMDEGGSVEHVFADTVLKEHLAAASLRFLFRHSREVARLRGYRSRW